MTIELPPVILRRSPCACGADLNDHADYQIVMDGVVVATLEVGFREFMTLWMAHDQRTLILEGFDD